MEENNNYIIYVNNQPVSVTNEVYQAYWKSVEHERYLIKQIKSTCFYLDHLLDDYERNIIELESIIDDDPTKNAAFKNILIEQLTKEISLLSEKEKELIKAIYFEGLSDSAYARKTNQKQTTVSKRHRNLLKKLRKKLKVEK